MKRVFSLNAWAVLLMVAAMGAACAPAATTDNPSGTTPAIVGTWVNNYENGGSRTNTYIFGTSSFTQIESQAGSVDTNSGTYTFVGDSMKKINILSGGGTNLMTNITLAMISGANLFYSEGSVYKLMSGSGWSGVYKSYSYRAWSQGSDLIIMSNFMLLTSTASNCTISGQTNVISTNGTWYYYPSMGAPPTGTVIPYAEISSDSVHSFDMMGSTNYFFKVGNYLIYSATNAIVASGSTYVKQ
ncbi:MAG: hypothetical protein HPY53_15175 [Brevinematales bacterium]|nr:hypothetical protein [Brevinematales bacterium]